jgi:excisionase family DNA binding protein
MSAARTDRWLTIAEVALELGVTASTVKRWISAGELPSFQPHPNGAVRIPVKALETHRRDGA